jgi:5-(aminomethyl)-3-furanmethanol phosphate kinase
MANDLVVKVGGSLADLPNLGGGLRSWLDLQLTAQILLVPGGGPAADWIRDLDASEHLGPERSHWLALRALTFAAHVLATRLPGAIVIQGLEEREPAWRRGQVPVLDMHTFARADEARPDHLEHSWDVTSDALAARVAVVAGMSHLVLLKSCSFSEPIDWSLAARRGLVDAAFPAVVRAAGRGLHVSALNFRAWQAAASSGEVQPATEP